MRLFTIAVIATLALVAARPTSAQCILDAPNFVHDRLRVEPKGTSAFELRVRELEARISISKSGRHSVNSKGPLEFEATVDNLWARVTKAHQSGNGDIHFSPGATLVVKGLRGTEAVGHGVIDAPDTLQGEDKDPEIFVRDVAVPCDKLVIGGEAASDGFSQEATVQDPGRSERAVYSFRKGRFRAPLRTKPSFSSPALVVESPHCNNCLQFVEEERQGRWRRVILSGPAFRVRGWLPVGWLVEDEALYGRPTMCMGDHEGTAVSGFGWGGGRPANAYEGPAQIKAGAAIFTEPNKGQWATAQEDISAQVVFVKGDDWVQIRGGLPGVSGAPFLRAYVRRQDVKLDTN